MLIDRRALRRLSRLLFRSPPFAFTKMNKENNETRRKKESNFWVPLIRNSVRSGLTRRQPVTDKSVALGCMHVMALYPKFSETEPFGFGMAQSDGNKKKHKKTNRRRVLLLARRVLLLARGGGLLVLRARRARGAALRCGGLIVG